MIEINLGDINVVENFKAIEKLRRTGMFTDEELQEMYDKQIEADKTVKAFCEKCKGYYDGHCVHRGECDIDVIQTAPAADVQPVKRGKWDGYICSECNVCADYFISGDFYFDEKPNFCPNCGARMDDDKKGSKKS